MPFGYDTEHLSRGLDRLIEQYKGKPVITALLSMLLNQVQDFELQIKRVYEGRFLANAVGVQLDTIGKFVGEERQGKNDDFYRLWLRIRIRANRSFGQSRDILDIGSLIIGNKKLRLDDPSTGPAAARLEFLEFTDSQIEDPNLIPTIQKIMRQIKPAGVWLSIVFPTRVPATTAGPTLAFFGGSVTSSTGHPGSPGSSVTDPGLGNLFSHVRRA